MRGAEFRRGVNARMVGSWMFEVGRWMFWTSENKRAGAWLAVELRTLNFQLSTSNLGAGRNSGAGKIPVWLEVGCSKLDVDRNTRGQGPGLRLNFERSTVNFQLRTYARGGIQARGECPDGWKLDVRSWTLDVLDAGTEEGRGLACG